MALPSPVQTAVSASTSLANPTATFGVGSTAGNTLICVISNKGNGGGGAVLPTIPTDNKSSTWAQVDQLDSFSGVAWTTGSFYILSNCPAGVTTVTGAGLTNSLAISMIIAEYPITNVSPLDVHAVAGGTGASPTSGNTGNTTFTTDLAIGWLASVSTSVTAPNPASDLLTATSATNQQCTISDALTSGIGVQSSSYATSGATPSANVCGIVLLKVSNNPTSGATGLLMGV